MTSPKLDTQFTDADGFYEALLDAHEGQSEEESKALNARLILILANQIGDLSLLKQCLALAKR
jgi:hypothetical protein